jgi:flagellar hook-basal body complex protein FliE
MPISPIGAVAIPNASALAPTSPSAPTRGTDTVGSGNDATGINDFADLLKQTSSSQSHADNLMTQAATGELTDLTGAMAAMTEAQLTTQLTVAVRNKAVESFNEIMRMQI